MVSSSNNAFRKANDYKERNYKGKRIQLTSPLLHIGVGSAGSLNIFEYVQENGCIYFPNQTALAAALHEPGNFQKPNVLQRGRRFQKPELKFLEKYVQLSREYVEIIEGRDDPKEKNKRIRTILNKLKQLYQEALGSQWLDNEENFPEAGMSDKWVEKPLTKDIAPMIRNGFGEIYIPGSSIKGAIRTALAYYLLKHHASARVSEIEQKLRSLTRKQIADKKTVLDDEPLIIAGQDKKLSMNSYLFSNFRLSYQNWKLGDPNTPNTDLMRAIKVSDSAPLLIDVDKDVNLPVVAEVISSSFREDGSQRIAERRASNYIEMVWNVKAEFTISIDTEMLSWFQHEQGMQIPPQLQTVEGILEICKEFAQAQWEHERQYWSKIKDSAQLDFGSIRSFYGKPCKYSLRLGWGSGMLGTTVSCSLPFEKSIRVNIRNACSTKQTSSSETPKSRRTAVIPNQGHPIKKPLGWVDFTPL